MLLAVDIGNSNIVLGGYHGDQLLFVARIRTDSLRTEFEYAVLIKDILSLYPCQPDDHYRRYCFVSGSPAFKRFFAMNSAD